MHRLVGQDEPERRNLANSFQSCDKARAGGSTPPRWLKDANQEVTEKEMSSTDLILKKKEHKLYTGFGQGLRPADEEEGHQNCF